MYVIYRYYLLSTDEVLYCIHIDKETTEPFLPQGKKGFCVSMAKRLHSSSMTAAFFRKEALIHSLSAFILEFL